MTGHVDTGNPDAEHGFRKEKEEEGNKTRAPSHGSARTRRIFR